MPYNGVSPPTAGELMCMFNTITSGAETMSLVQFEGHFDDPDAVMTACLGATLAPTPGPPPSAAQVFAFFDKNSDTVLSQDEFM